MAVTVEVTVHDYEHGADKTITITFDDDAIAQLVEVINLPEE
jgi:hypothetical protein